MPIFAPDCPPAVTLEPTEDRALLALQGPQAATVLARHLPEARPAWAS